MPSKLSFELVCKLHGLCAIFFGAVFTFASFGLSLPVLGPEALLAGWDVSNPALVYMTRFCAGVMFGVGAMEFFYASSEGMKKIFVGYHAILAALTLLSSAAAATWGLSWLYAGLVTMFLIGGVIGDDSDYTAV